MARMPVLHLRVRNDLAAVETACRALRDFVVPLGRPPRVLYRLELVLELTLMNLLWFLWPEGGEHHTTFDIDALPDVLRLHFEDDGQPLTRCKLPRRCALRMCGRAQPAGARDCSDGRAGGHTMRNGPPRRVTLPVSRGPIIATVWGGASRGPVRMGGWQRPEHRRRVTNDVQTPVFVKNWLHFRRNACATSRC